MQKVRSTLSYILRFCFVIFVIASVFSVAFFGEIQGEKVINFAKSGLTSIKNFKYAEGIKQLELAQKSKNRFFKLYLYVSTGDTELIETLSSENLNNYIIIAKINMFANMLGNGDVKSLSKNNFLKSLERDFSKLTYKKEIYVATLAYLKRILPMVKDCKNKNYRKAYDNILPFWKDDLARVKSGEKKEILALKPLCYIFYEMARNKMEDQADFDTFISKILFYANLRKKDPFFLRLAAKASKLSF